MRPKTGVRSLTMGNGVLRFGQKSKAALTAWNLRRTRKDPSLELGTVIMVTNDLGACEWFVWDLRRSGLIDRGQLDQVVNEFQNIVEGFFGCERGRVKE